MDSAYYTEDYVNDSTSHQVLPPVVEVEVSIVVVPLAAAVHRAAVPLAPGGDVRPELVPVELGSRSSKIAAPEIDTLPCVFAILRLV